MVQLLWMLTTGIHMETNGSLLWIATSIDDEVAYVAWKEIKLAGIHVWFNHAHCNNLSFDPVHCGGFGSFPSTSFLRQLPKNYSMLHSCMLPDIRSGCSWRFMKMVLAVPLQFVFLPFLTKFLMKGFVRWVLPFLTVWSFPFGCMLVHGGRCIWLWYLGIA